MRRKNWRLAGVLLATMAVVGGLGVVGMAALYGSLTISGLTGDGLQFNGVELVYSGMTFGKPSFGFWDPGVVYASLQWIGDQWSFMLDDDGYRKTFYFGGLYGSAADTEIPPELGWVLEKSYSGYVHSGTLRLIGGAAATSGYVPPSFVSVAPTGDGGGSGYLDAPSASFAVGDTISGSLKLLDGDGRSVLGSVHIYVYSIDSSGNHVLVSHLIAEFNWSTRQYEFSIDTSGLSPGSYDLAISIDGASTTYVGFELTP